MNKILIRDKEFRDVQKVKMYDAESKSLLTFSDTSGDSVKPNNLLKGATAHDKDGNKIEGTVSRPQFATSIVGEINFNFDGSNTMQNGHFHVIVSRTRLDGGSSITAE